MPRGGPPTYTYTLPPVYLAVPGTVILATQHNDPLEDIETAFNTEWPGYLIQWVVPTADVLFLPNGAVGAPALSFTNDTDSGLYRIGANNLGVSVNGAKVLDVSATGLGVTGTTLTGAGTVSLPGFGFTGDPNSGFYSIGADNIGLALAGLTSWDYAASVTTYTWADDGASAGPSIETYRISTTPAATDGLGPIDFYGRDSAGNKQIYAEILPSIVNPTSTSEDGTLALRVTRAGTITTLLRAGIAADNATGGEMIGLPKGQLSFPATQNPSSDANTLDDYDEVVTTTTWAFATPGTSSFVYGTNEVNYTKVGNAVFISMDLSVTPTIGTGSGTLTITIAGWPYTLTNLGPLAISTINSAWTWPASRTQVVALWAIDGTFTITGLGTGVSQTAFAASNMSTGVAHVLRISGVGIVG